MDYKKLIEQLRNTNCSGCMADTMKETATAIETMLSERNTAISLLREINWCAGCVHFSSRGCENNAMSLCCEGDDHYQFFSQQNEEIRK